MIGKILALGLAAFSSIYSFYNVGAYAHGKRQVVEGKAAIAANAVSSLAYLTLGIIWYLDW